MRDRQPIPTRPRAGSLALLALGLGLALLPCGCSDTPAAPASEPDPVDDVTWAHPGGVQISVTATPAGEATLLPDWATATGPAARARQRVDIDQLSASLSRVTGGVGWEDANGEDQFELLASTLGKPDFATNTIEEMAPALLFQKFLDDAARSACVELMTRELIAAPADRVFFVHLAPDEALDAAGPAVDENLAYLLLRFHGTRVDPGAPPLEPWRWLLETTALGTDDVVAAWRNVCVTLITHPDFYTY